MRRTRITKNTFENRAVISVGGKECTARSILDAYIEVGGLSVGMDSAKIQERRSMAQKVPEEQVVPEILKLQDKMPTICNLDNLKAFWKVDGGPEDDPREQMEKEEFDQSKYETPEKEGGENQLYDPSIVPGKANKKGLDKDEAEGLKQQIEGKGSAEQEAAKSGEDILKKLMQRDDQVYKLATEYTDDGLKKLAEIIDGEVKVLRKGVGKSEPVQKEFIVKIHRPEQEPERKDQVYHPHFPVVLACAQARVPVYMVGPAGTGKTTIGRQVADALEIDYYPMSFNSMMSHSSLFGFVPVTGDGYQGTPFRHAYEKGGVNLWDEVDAANPNIMTGANMATSNHCCAFPDKVVNKHENFVLLAGANTYGRGATRNYVGRNALDAATLDRFAFVEIDYDHDFEESMLVGRQVAKLVEVYEPEGKDKVDGMKWMERVRSIRSVIETLDIRIVLSPRVVLYGTRLLGQGVKQEWVENVLVWWKMDTATRQRVMTAMPGEKV